MLPTSDAGGSLEAGVEVGDDVVDGLDPDGQPNQIRLNASVGLLFGRQLAVRRAGRMDRQAAHVANVGDVAVQPQALHELLASLGAAFDPECQH